METFRTPGCLMTLAHRSDHHCGDVYAIIVTFNPDIRALRELLKALLTQVGGAAIVDNSSTNEMALWQPDDYANLQIHRLESNIGVAAAQNYGVELARQHCARYVLLSDQDSIPADSMVTELKQALLRLESSGTKVAAVGPWYLDPRHEHPSPFTRTEGFRSKRYYEGTDGVVLVDHLISSGCLIPIQTLDAAGGMASEMFIDYVDTEWGLRASHLGFKSFGVFSAVMTHSLGEEIIQGAGKSLPGHSPLRHYYMVRNGIWLCKQRYVPLNWRLVDLYKLFLRIIFYAAFSKSRTKHVFMMLRGVGHGLMSRLGPA